MTRIRGQAHVRRPTVSSLLTIEFADAPGSLGDLTEWHLRMGGVVCRTIADGPGAFKAFAGILEELGEQPAWEWLERVAINTGFDTYWDATMFEIYRGHTDDTRTPIAVLRYTIQDAGVSMMYEHKPDFRALKPGRYPAEIIVSPVSDTVPGTEQEGG